MTVPPLILVSGFPASGKTTAARALSAALGLPCFHKDDVKELLFDQLGTADRAWSKKLGVASIALIWQAAETLLARGQGVMLESTFEPQWANAEVVRRAERVRFQLVQVLCEASPEELARRFAKRASSSARHSGHGDAENVAAHRRHVYSNSPHFLDWPGEKLRFDGERDSLDELTARVRGALISSPPSPFRP